MKKLLLIALLTVALVFTMVACTTDEPKETTGETTADTTPATEGDATEPEGTKAPETTEETKAPETTEETKAPETTEETKAPETTEETKAPETTEETKAPETAEETKAPETEPEVLPECPGVGTATQVKPSWDSIYKNDEGNLAYTPDGGAAEKFTAAPTKLDDTWHTLMVRGWAGSGDASNKIEKFGYRIDLGELIIDEKAYRDAEEGVINAGGDARYCISIPADALKGGFHYVRGYGICADGTAVEILNMWIEGRDLNALELAKPWDDGKEVVTHLSFDELRDGGNGIFAPGASAGWDKVATLADGVTMLQYWGWIGIVTDTIGQFGYMIDDNAAIFDDAWTHATGQDVLDAAAGTGAATASRMLVNIDFSGLYGEHTVKTLYKGSDGQIAILTEFKVICPPDPNTTINVEFNAADETGTTVGGSNLSGTFAFTQAAAGPSVIEDGAYILKDFTEAIANPDGYYAFTANIDSVGNHKLSAMFLRGVYNFNFGDGGYFGAIFSNGINESESNGGKNTNYSGSAGIYLVAANEGLGVTNLTIRFHCWDGSAVTIKEYMIPVNSTKITAVDKGNVVYILADNELAATITISGVKDFGYTGQNGAVVDPEACAETVAIKTATIDEIVPNAVVAATCKSHIGLATRAGGGSISVSYVSLKPASSVTIPDNFTEVAPPVDYINLALGKDTSLTTSVENDANIPANATDGDPATRWGAFPTGEASFIVNFGEITKVRYLQLDFENTVLPWTVYVSTDGQSWTEMYKGKSGGGRTEVVDFGELIELQYVKITRDTEPEGQGSNWFSIYEFIAYGEATVESEKDLVINKTEYAFGEDILVTAKGETADQWVGLYSIGDNYEGGAVASLYWYYINADGHTSGETYVINQLANHANSDRADLTHLPAGQYKIILFADGGYTALEQVEFTVLPLEQKSLTTDKTEYVLGETINIKACTDGTLDWIAVYPAGAADYLGYYYPIGPVLDNAFFNTRNCVDVDLNAMLASMNTPVGPLTAGSYDIVMHANNGSEVIAKITITITEAAPAEDLTIDLTALSNKTGYAATWDAAGYTVPHYKLGYNGVIELGAIDLSKYSAVKISYGCDGSQVTADNFAAASSLAIGLKSEASSYGQATDDNFTGDIAHTDMEFVAVGWAGGQREAVVDLTGVDYNGNVWVTVHNPAGTEIVIDGIVFIA